MAAKFRYFSVFSADQRGVIAITFSFALLVIGLSAGLAIDLSRQRLAYTITSSAMDAAVLAGARWLQLNPTDTTGAIAAANTFYQANIVTREPVLSDTVSFISVDNDTAIAAEGSASIATTFVALAGVNSLPIVTTDAAAFPKASLSVGGSGGSNIEISLVLDVTGSMCDDGVGPCTTGTKISGLKAAATDLINIVVATDQSQHTSKVALVPFSTRIRVGPDGGGAAMMKTLTNLNSTMNYWYDICTASTGSGGSETAGNWSCSKYVSTYESNWLVMPCVTERRFDNSAGIDFTDDAPGPGKWLNAHDGTRDPISSDSSDTALTSGTGTKQTDPAWDWNYEPSGNCYDTLAGNEIQPLTSDKTVLNNRIAALQAYGATSGALATQWSWYMLSPNWNGVVWSGINQPGSYSDVILTQPNGAPVLRKVAVIMTDGGFNAYRSWKEQDQQAVSNWAVQVCTNMKAKGIEVYTVGFALDQLPAAQQPIATATLQACGSDISHFYQTLTIGDLQTAFRAIAVKLAGLHLTQ